VWFFGESFEGARMQGFALIWAACALFTVDMLMRQQHTADLARLNRDAARGIVDTSTDFDTRPADLDVGAGPLTPTSSTSMSAVVAAQATR
jgi:hypothetical protein